MSKAQHPNGWPRIERNIKLRADFRCECGAHYDCNGAHHIGRCPNREGSRYAHNKRLIKLRVVQVRPGIDWQPTNLVALCLVCWLRWKEAQDEDVTGLEDDGLFDHLHT